MAFFGRILHGDGFGASQNFAQTFGEVFHARVVKGFSSEVRERMRFNLVHEFSGHALGGHKVKPAAGAHGLRQFQDALSDGVAAAKIVKEPAVNARCS